MHTVLVRPERNQARASIHDQAQARSEAAPHLPGDALERLKPEAPAYVPWAWGINGIFSVMAPILSVGFAITWGANALLLAAVPIYLVAGLALPSPRAAAR